MVNRDKAGSFTIEQLKQQYNLDNKQITKLVEQQNGELKKVENELSNTISSIIINLGSLLESQSDISLWFFSGIPTLENKPYSDWQNPTDHEGDLYYDRNTGIVYKYLSNEWQEQNDENLKIAMATTNIETDIADNERKVFLQTPSPPYNSGDWYIKEDGTLYICQLGKPSGDYEEQDFIIFNKYQDTVAIKENNKITVLTGRVTTVETGINQVRTTMEENKYYEDEEGNRHLISETVSENKQAIDEIEAKVEQVKLVSDVKTGNTSITLENAYEGTLHYLSIVGEITDIFPATNLYPTSTLYPKDTYLLVDNNRYHLDFTYLRYINDQVCDKWVCIDGKQSIERNVGVDGNGNYYALAEPYIEEKEDLIIPVQNDSTISMESFSNIKLNAIYLLQNDYTNTFAPTVDLISKINLSPGQAQIQARNIKLEGYTTINENFGVDLEGNMWAKNASFSGNIFLDDGNKVIGGDGMLTQFHYTGSGKCGFTVGASRGWRNAVYLAIYIPINFKPISAELVITHNPGYTYEYNMQTESYNYYNCYVRNAKIYYATQKQPSADSSFSFETAPTTEGTVISTINNTTNGKTFDSEVTETVTIDLNTNILNTGNQFLYIADYVDSIPTSDTSLTLSFRRSGYVTLDLFVSGYVTTK